eukprot:1259423-Alexandrium_andersonii.AAC.1
MKLLLRGKRADEGALPGRDAGAWTRGHKAAVSGLSSKRPSAFAESANWLPTDARTHAHARTRARAHARTRAGTHTHASTQARELTHARVRASTQARELTHAR